jgi:hypothetical protein
MSKPRVTFKMQRIAEDDWQILADYPGAETRVYSDNWSVVYLPAEFTTRTPLIRRERLVPTKYKPRYVTAMTQHHDGARSESSRHASTIN